MSYVVRQLLISDSQAVQELIASRNGTNYYGTSRMISSEKLNVTFSDPYNFYVAGEHTAGKDYDPVRDIIYVQGKNALIGLFEGDSLVSFTAVRNISKTSLYYAGVFFVISDLNKGSRDKNIFLLKRTIEKLHDVGSSVVYLSMPTALKDTSYWEVTKDYDAMEIISNMSRTFATAALAKYMVIDQTKPFWYYNNSIYVMRKKHALGQAV